MSELAASQPFKYETAPADHDGAWFLDRPLGESCAGEWFGAHELKLVRGFWKKERHKAVTYRVQVWPLSNGRGIGRQVFHGKTEWPRTNSKDPWRPSFVIWPNWSGDSDTKESSEPPKDSDAGLNGEVEYWMRTGTRIRDAARWMAAILGLALSALIGTAPFTNIRSDELTRASATFAMAGLLFIAITMFLVLRVLIPLCDDVRRYPGSGPKSSQGARSLVEVDQSALDRTSELEKEGREPAGSVPSVRREVPHDPARGHGGRRSDSCRAVMRAGVSGSRVFGSRPKRGRRPHSRRGTDSAPTPG